jgi:hypothetical protein
MRPFSIMYVGVLKVVTYPTADPVLAQSIRDGLEHRNNQQKEKKYETENHRLTV